MAVTLDEIQLPTQLGDLSRLVGERPQALATADEELRIAALRATKHIYDLGERHRSLYSK